MKTLKKALALLLALSMCLSVMSIGAFAADDEIADDETSAVEDVAAGETDAEAAEEAAEATEETTEAVTEESEEATEATEETAEAAPEEDEAVEETAEEPAEATEDDAEAAEEAAGPAEDETAEIELPGATIVAAPTEEELAAAEAEAAARIAAEEEAARLEAERLAAQPELFPAEGFTDYRTVAGYTVTVVVEPESFAEAVSLRVMALGWNTIDEATRELLLSSGLTEDDALLDIGFINADAEEIEPLKPVAVSIEAEEAEIAEVYHVEDEETITRVAEDVADVAEFAVEGFSLFAIKGKQEGGEFAVEGVMYDTIDALNTAISGATAEIRIEMQGDVEMTTAEKISIPSDKTVILDLGGHTLTSGGYIIENRGTLTVQNGVIAMRHDYYYAYAIYNYYSGPTVLIENLTVKNADASNFVDRVIYGNYNAITIKSAKIDYTGASYPNYPKAAVGTAVLKSGGWAYYSAGGVTLNRSSATLATSAYIPEGMSNTLQLTATPTNESKAVTFTSTNPAVASVDENGFVTAVSGGTAVIMASVSDYEFATCTVTVGEYVAEYNGNAYTLAGAFSEAASSGGTIRLTGNASVQSDISIPSNANITLDISGHTLKTASSSYGAFYMASNRNAKLTLTDSVGSGKIIASGNALIYKYSGNEAYLSDIVVEATAKYVLYTYGKTTSTDKLGLSNVTINASATDRNTGTEDVVYINGNVEVTISDSTLTRSIENTYMDSSSAIVSALYARSGAAGSGGPTVRISGTTLRGSADDVLEVNRGAKAYIMGDSVVIENIRGSDDAIYAGAFSSDDTPSEVTIEGGTFSGTITGGNNCVYTIYGGTFANPMNALLTSGSSVIIDGGSFCFNSSYIYSSDNLTITGGTFLQEVGGVTDVQTYVSSGYTQDMETGEVHANDAVKITGDMVTVADAHYSGAAVEAAVTVTCNGATLTAGTDYEVVYQNNNAVGTGSVTIKGRGNYYGAVTKTFSITTAQYTITWSINGVDTTETLAYGATPSYKGSTPTKAADAQYTYTFTGWSPEITTVTSDATYTAQFSGTKNSYTITWKNDDGTTIDTTTVEYGVVPTHTDPTKAADAQYTYAFAGWSPAIATVTGDATYTATFSETVNKYTITWSIDGTETTEAVDYGATPSHIAPSKTATVESTYAFTGWSPEIVPVTGPATYTAQFSASPREYTIVFVNADNTELQRGAVAYGTTPSYNGETPTKAADAQYTYTFAGWDTTPAAVTGDATYTATFDSTVNQYSIQWVVDGVTTTQTLAYGATPTHTDPTKAANAQYTYTFAGWSPAIATVTGNATYTAQFDATVNEYTVTWSIEGVETTETLAYGTTPAHNAPTKDATAQYTYTFAGWKSSADGKVYAALPAVKGDVTYTATFTQTLQDRYTVTWISEGKVLKINQNVAYGATPAYTGAAPYKSADAEYTYTFSGWSPAITTVTGDATYTAQFDATPRTYTVTFKTWNGATLSSKEYAHNETPSYEGSTPTKAATAQYTYTFSGWSPAITSVTGNATYTAQFSETVNRYKVTWVINGVETKEEYEYGTTPSHDSPANYETDSATYTFVGWDSEIKSVTKNAVYTAVYKSQAKTYTVTFVNPDNSAEDRTLTLAYGATPIYSGVPTKSADETNTYQFIGWSPAISAVTDNTTYTAQFAATAIPFYTASFLNYDGTTLQSGLVAEGSRPVYGSDVQPTRDSVTYDAKNEAGDTVRKTLTYTFKGWTNGTSTYAWGEQLPAIGSDVTYTAAYSVKVDDQTLTTKAETVTVEQTDGTTKVETTTVVETDGLKVEEKTTSEVAEVKDDSGIVTGTSSTTTAELTTTIESTTTVASQKLSNKAVTNETTIKTTAADGEVTTTKTETSNSQKYDHDVSSKIVTYTETESTKTVTTDASVASVTTTSDEKTIAVALTPVQQSAETKVNMSANSASDEIKEVAQNAENSINPEQVDVQTIVENIIKDKELKDANGKVKENAVISVQLELRTELTKAEAATAEKEKTITYDVKPMMTVTVGDVESDPVEVKNTQLKDDSINVKLPIPSDFATTGIIRVTHSETDGYRKVYHCDVQSGSGYDYVEFEVDRFSSFEIEDSSAVNVTFNSGGGSSVAAQTLEYNETATAPTAPTRSGYRFSGWYLDGDAYNFGTLVTGDLTLTAKWTRVGGGNSDSGDYTPATQQITTIADEETPLSEFPIFYVDVAEDSWYHDAIAYVTALGVMNGVSDDKFSPNASTTRGMVATVLMRMASGEAVDLNSFFDVASDAYYAEAAAWAVENGVFKGYDDGSFRGEINITREQFAAVLYRYALAMGYNVSGKASLDAYDDGTLVSGYASEAMAWAAESGIIQGIGGNKLDPTGKATRAQLATMLMRFDELIKDEV